MQRFALHSAKQCRNNTSKAPCARAPAGVCVPAPLLSPYTPCFLHARRYFLQHHLLLSPYAARRRHRVTVLSGSGIGAACSCVGTWERRGGGVGAAWGRRGGGVAGTPPPKILLRARDTVVCCSIHQSHPSPTSDRAETLAGAAEATSEDAARSHLPWDTHAPRPHTRAHAQHPPFCLPSHPTPAPGEPHPLAPQ